MPRKPIEISTKIEYLSILDENAQVDKKLEPDISAKDLKTMYRYMVLARRTDERMLLMQRQGRMGTFPQSSGHEAISIASVLHLKQADWLVPAYRELAGMLYRGWPIENWLLYWSGFEEGAKAPEGVNDLPVCVPIATQMLHAAGIGMAMNIRNEKKVVLTFFGDGASYEGDCHEALNFASVFVAPVVFICVNNQYAISVPLSRQMKSETVAQRACAYGMPGIRVDGNDVLAIYVATAEAVERARKGEGPTLIEALTYRYTPHTTADDPKRYRSEKEDELWAKREPISRFAKYLENKNILSAKERQAMEQEIDDEIKAAVERALTMAKSAELNNPLSIFDYLYHDIPPILQAQRDEVAARFKNEKKERRESKTANPQRAQANA
jgi:pyruvate dehydrogenase E1 component alpha subunit